KRLEGISDIVDQSDRDGMRIVIDIKRDANPQVVLNRLFAQTQMQTSFAINMLALVDNQKQPKILSLRHIIDEYLAFQEDLIVRRTRYDLRKAQERAHILEGLLIAQDHIDEVIKTIRESYDNAKENLMAKFSLSEVQAQAICDMRLIALQGLNREKLQAEYDELEKKIAYYNELLGSETMLRQVLKDELTEIRDKYGDERKTEIQEVEDEIDIEDLIEEEQCVYTLTHKGYIKRTPADEYAAQKRGGKGVRGMTTREEDYVEAVFTASTHDYILFFTNKGRVHRKKGYLIPEAGRAAKGTSIVNVLPLDEDEHVTAGISVRSLDVDDQYLFFVTKNGTVKRIELRSINTRMKAGIRALTLEQGDELIEVRLTDGNQNIILATHEGMSICFDENDVRVMGRDAVGVRGIRLRDEDYVIGAARAHEGKTLLAITENGYGKRTPVEEYMRGDEPQSRGGKGLKGYQITEKTGALVAIKVVDGDEDVLLVSDDGTIIRTPVSSINVYSRTAQGVRVMRLPGDAQVISIARAEKEDTAAEDGEPQTAETEE
ncbi:MAG: DNA gyrase subunit A, partial [Oscillospiraceae bacterium]|nr:DNA gyrase subunit A [Oscillospiraceae bacterium]